ncbi:MAG: site-2 protease family protein [Candidatus Dormibacteraeota bacterium]|nr:site-2 protease family protein [Candidatus Dormibacteraeota bacterium]
MLGFGDPVAFLVGSVFLIPAILIAIPAHELGHGIAALLMGDPSPRNRGYLVPRPQLFLNLYGVITVFLANVGFGTPIPVNEYRLKGIGRKVVYALAGPATNLVLAVVFGLLVRYLVLQSGAVVPVFDTRIHALLDYVGTACYAIFFLNLAMFAFQLLPVPGLDGWRVVEGLFRNRFPRFFFNVAGHTQQIWLVAVAIVFFGPILLRFSVLGAVVGIFFEPASLAILGTCAGYTSLSPCPVSAHF